MIPAIDGGAAPPSGTRGDSPTLGVCLTAQESAPLRDPNQLAKFIVDAATGAGDDASDAPKEQGKNPAAVALGRLGGLKGGKARAESLSAKKRREIAR